MLLSRMAEDKPTEYSVIVIGGGIAGVTCTETLAALSPDTSVLMISASPIIKSVVNFKQLTKTIEQFDVKEQDSNEFLTDKDQISVIHDAVSALDSSNRIVSTESGRKYQYKKLCICSGGRPKIIFKENPFVIGIRDTETIEDFRNKVANARRILVVGNGGIATEIVYNVQICDVIWAIKDESIVSTFVDAGAAKFFLPHLSSAKLETNNEPVKRHKYKIEDDVSSSKKSRQLGASLGPDWVDTLNLPGSGKNDRKVTVEYQVEIKRLLTADDINSLGLNVKQTNLNNDEIWPLYVELTNDKIYGCDFLVSATGVTPNIQCFLDGNQLSVAEDGGLKVNSFMQTTVSNVYAAGDACNASWDVSPHWLQMRLWSQARQMGHYAAKCIIADLNNELCDIQQDFCFELFAHCTRFFGYKVVILGQFNGQGLNNDYEILARVVEGEKYIKVILKDGRMLGAVLVGETDLEETFENLILNQIDLSRYGDELLEQDIEDFFD